MEMTKSVLDYWRFTEDSFTVSGDDKAANGLLLAKLGLVHDHDLVVDDACFKVLEIDLSGKRKVK